jgi:predicted solute-binding protein
MSLFITEQKFLLEVLQEFLKLTTLPFVFALVVVEPILSVAEK